MSRFLKKAKEYKPKISVKYLLHQHLTGPDPARSLKTIHASSLTRPEGYCPREAALYVADDKKPSDRWLTTSEAMTYQIGRDQERNIVLWLGQMGRSVGNWVCSYCKHKHVFCTMPSACTQCGCKALEPEELRFTSAISGASCGVDLCVKLSGPKLRIVELKTIDKEKFKELKAPLAEHRLRTNLYLRIIAESDHSWSNMFETKTASVLYVSKGGYGCLDPQVKQWGLSDSFSPFKEYPIKRDDSQTDGIMSRSKALFHFLNGEAGMPSGICKTALDPRAKSCPRKKACFSGKFPPENDWTQDV